MRLNFKHDGRRWQVVYFETENKLYLVSDPGTDKEKVYDVKVIENSEFVIKKNKKSFSAIDGARGLFKFFKQIVEKEFMECYLWRFVDEVPRMFSAL